MQSVYSTAPADWAEYIYFKILINYSYEINYKNFKIGIYFSLPLYIWRRKKNEATIKKKKWTNIEVPEILGFFFHDNVK